MLLKSGLIGKKPSGRLLQPNFKITRQKSVNTLNHPTAKKPPDQQAIAPP